MEEYEEDQASELDDDEDNDEEENEEDVGGNHIDWLGKTDLI